MSRVLSPVAETKLLAGLPRSLDEEGVFEGYASLFGEPDLGRDVVEPGAFAASLSRRGTAGIRMLWQHDPAQPIGAWSAIREDARGLFVRGRLNLDTARGREVHALMRGKAVDGLSIGYRVERARADPLTRVRRLQRLDLWEISVVTFPMLPQARIAAVKHTDPARRLRALARFAHSSPSPRPRGVGGHHAVSPHPKGRP